MERSHLTSSFLFAIFCLDLFSASAQRRLAPGPYSEEDIVIQRCIDLTTSAGEACNIESDISAQVFPRDSTELPTSKQTVRAISALKGASLPSPNCCEQLKPFIRERCVCLPGFQQLLPLGGFEEEYFEGAAKILALACRTPMEPCSATPPTKQPPPQPPPVGVAGSEGPSAG
jgi:hypothetical protein